MNTQENALVKNMGHKVIYNRLDRRITDRVFVPMITQSFTSKKENKIIGCLIESKVVDIASKI